MTSLKRMTQTHRCKCGKGLAVAWSAEKNDYFLRCARDKSHTEFVRREDEVAERLRAMEAMVKRVEKGE